MKYTFEITIAGCATNCGHCYVGGGPGPIMSYHDYALCLERLVPALNRLRGDISLNLGNETFCHPHVVEFFQLTDRVCPQFFDRRGEDFPTTGIALLRHRDRESILTELKRKGIEELFFAIHGGREAHDVMVQRPGRFEQLFETADFLTERGLKVAFSLMLTKALIPGLEEVLARIGNYPHARIYPIVPLYCPTPRMRRYQQYRLEAASLLALCGPLDAWGIQTVKPRRLAAECSEQAVWASTLNLEAQLQAAPNWAFFHVTRDLKLYYGNVGMHTRYLGDLRQMSCEDVYRAIQPMGPNYDYEAFYPLKSFEKLREIPRPATDRVYPSPEYCYYAWLDELGEKNLLIK